MGVFYGLKEVSWRNVEWCILEVSHSTATASVAFKADHLFFPRFQAGRDELMGWGAVEQVVFWLILVSKNLLYANSPARSPMKPVGELTSKFASASQISWELPFCQINSAVQVARFDWAPLFAFIIYSWRDVTLDDLCSFLTLNYWQKTWKRYFIALIIIYSTLILSLSFDVLLGFLTTRRVVYHLTSNRLTLISAPLD